MAYSGRYTAIEKCPHCKKIIKRHSVSKSGFLKGSPIRTCLRCKGTYVFPEYKEWGLVLFADNGRRQIVWEILWVLLFNPAAAFYLRSVTQEVLSLDLLLKIVVCSALAILSNCLLVQTIKNCLHREEYHQKQVNYIEGRTKERPRELVESMERLSSKEYLDTLKEHRIDVPDYFYERLNSVREGIE